jgi:hypothetical protein
LNRPITRLERKIIHTDPKGFLSIKVDGRRTYFEWLNAGHYVAGSERGTMTLVSDSIVKEIYFGFDTDRLMLRIDTAGRAKSDLSQVDELRIIFIEPNGYVLRIANPTGAACEPRLYRNNELVDDAKIQYAVDHILELTVRFADLHVRSDDQVHLFLEAWAEQQSLDRAPREGALELTVPSADYERIMWQA